MVKETELPCGLKRAIITNIIDGGHIMAIEEADGGKHIGRRFALCLNEYRIPILSKDGSFNWERVQDTKAISKGIKTKHVPVRNGRVIFESSVGGKIVGWCSNFDFLKSRINAKKF